MIKPASEFIAEAQAKITCLDVSSAKALFDESENAAILDVREADSAAASCVTGSVNISRGLIEMKAPTAFPDPETVILVHCGGGGRASLAAARLKEMGYQNAHAITAKFEDIKAAFG